MLLFSFQTAPLKNLCQFSWTKSLLCLSSLLHVCRDVHCWASHCSYLALGQFSAQLLPVLVPDNHCHRALAERVVVVLEEREDKIRFLEPGTDQVEFFYPIV